MRLKNRRKDEARAVCGKCGVALIVGKTIRASAFRQHDYKCNGCIREREMSRRREEKRRIIEAYGGRCSCCGETRWQFLTIDHVGGGGRAARKNEGTSWLYVWLRNAGYPKDKHRLHCMNCNFSRGRYGHCPHDAESAAQARGA